jgi:hypothetical protein
MQPIELLEKPWTNILIDFVTGLLLLRDPTIELAYDAILVIVDCFTKYALFIPFRKNYTAI